MHLHVRINHIPSSGLGILRLIHDPAKGLLSGPFYFILWLTYTTTSKLRLLQCFVRGFNFKSHRVNYNGTFNELTT